MASRSVICSRGGFMTTSPASMKAVPRSLRVLSGAPPAMVSTSSVKVRSPSPSTAASKAPRLRVPVGSAETWTPPIT